MATIPLTTPAYARQWPLPAQLVALDDTALTGLIDTASRVIEAECRQTFGTTTYTEEINGNGTGTFFLSHRPVQSITLITTFGTADRSNPVLIDPARYAFDARTGEVRAGSGPFYPYGTLWFWPETSLGAGFQNIEVVYTAGLADTPDGMPWDLQIATVMVVTNLFADLKRDMTKQSEHVGPHSISYTKVNTKLIDGRIADILKPYKFYSLG